MADAEEAEEELPEGVTKIAVDNQFVLHSMEGEIAELEEELRAKRQSIRALRAVVLQQQAQLAERDEAVAAMGTRLGEIEVELESLRQNEPKKKDKKDA